MVGTIAGQTAAICSDLRDILNMHRSVGKNHENLPDAILGEKSLPVYLNKPGLAHLISVHAPPTIVSLIVPSLSLILQQQYSLSSQM